jgi:plasmid stabilization system protein ParE
MTTTRIHRVARREIDDAAAYYEAHREGTGARFIATVFATLDLLREHPHAGRPVQARRPDVELRQIKTPGFPYSIVYWYRSSVPEVLVIAIAHARRRPRYWAWGSRDL